MYKSLKDGWLPLTDLCEKYAKDKSNMLKLIKSRVNDSDKELISSVWVVKESTFAKEIKIEYQQSDYVQLRELIDTFAENLVKHLDSEMLKHKLLSITDMSDGQEIANVFFELAAKYNIEMPIKLANSLRNKKDFSKEILITKILSRSFKE